MNQRELIEDRSRLTSEVARLKVILEATGMGAEFELREREESREKEAFRLRFDAVKAENEAILADNRNLEAALNKANIRISELATEVAKLKGIDLNHGSESTDASSSEGKPSSEAEHTTTTTTTTTGNETAVNEEEKQGEKQVGDLLG